MSDAPHHFAIEQPSDWVARFAPSVPAGLVLDLACGGGRHARHFALLGHPVLAVDRNAEALERVAALGLARVQVQQADLELPADQVAAQDGWPFAPSRFAGIVVTNYLHRPLFPAMLQSLQPGGVLIYETFALGNERHGKPSNPAFLLQPGELLQQLAGQGRPVHVLAFEDGYVEQPRPARVQRICLINSADPQDAQMSLQSGA